MIVTVSTDPVFEVETDAAIVYILEDQKELSTAVAQVDERIGGALKALQDEGDVTGELHETEVLYPGGALQAKRVVVAGVGKREEITLDRFRQASGRGAKKARKKGAKKISLVLPDAEYLGLSVRAMAQAGLEGALMGLYRSKDHKSSDSGQKTVNEIQVLVAPGEEAEEGVRLGQIFADAVCTARDLVNQPGNLLSPSMLADVAKAISLQEGLECEILAEEKMEHLGMGALLAVAKGSSEKPALIVMEYNGTGEEENSAERTAATVVLVGKGITFDSGGINLKPGSNMEEMKTDMAGAAAVIAVMQGAARLKLPLRVIGLAPAAENLPSGSSYKPGDVLTAMNKKTIEVINTDAEGRLVLADALCYASRYEPDAVISVATLTGACVVALGEEVAAGLFSDDEALCSRLTAAGEAAGEKLWRLPLYEEYREKIKSDIADMKNTGGRFGGVGTSAALLKEFVTAPWAHLDIAGMALAKSESSYTPKGGTGFSVRTLLNYLMELSGESGTFQ